jgi:hypothetical protein
VDGLSGSAHPMSQTDVLINPTNPRPPNHQLQTAPNLFHCHDSYAFKPNAKNAQNFHKTLNTKRLSYWNVQHNIINKTKDGRMSKERCWYFFFSFRVGFAFT